MESEDQKQLLVQGRLTSGSPAHTAVVLDSERSRFGDYWARPYSGTIHPDTGRFEVSVTRPFRKGTLYLSFCFENGANTADGKKSLQRGSAVEISYSGEPGAREFNILH